MKYIILITLTLVMTGCSSCSEILGLQEDTTQKENNGGETKLEIRMVE